MRLVEGQQYFINRITFVGNTTTHDNVIRRELRLVEDGVFNTEALKFSVRRLNQLGYFKPLEDGKDITVDKTPGDTNKVDVKVKLEEQNRNQISFGAGVSEFEGFFGQASFQTSELPRPRREPHGVAVGRLPRAELHAGLHRAVPVRPEHDRQRQSVPERRALHRPVHAALGGRRHRVRVSRSAALRGCSPTTATSAFASPRSTRLYTDPLVLARNPFLRDSLLIGANGERIISKVTPSLVHNTVDQPIFPQPGRPLHGRRSTSPAWAATPASTSRRSRGSGTGVRTRGMSLGMRAQGEYIHSHRRLEGAADLPEDLPRRRVFRPRVRHPEHRPAGSGDRPGARRQQEPAVQHRAELQHHEPVPHHPVLRCRTGARGGAALRVQGNADAAGRVRPAAPLRPRRGPEGAHAAPTRSSASRVSAFKTSTGVEARLFMPVINVPFRLIFAYNPQRAGVLGNDLQPQKAFQFRFAVGTTF